MTWAKATEWLCALHAELVEPYHAEKRKMFGFQVFFVNNNMFSGVFEDGIMMRLSPEDKLAALDSNNQITPFVPMGREMREYIFIPGNLLNEPSFIHEVKGWLEKSYTFVATLPPKVPKPRKK
ncbi:MAG: TfoX/Sxy family protein [Actinomycetia bacterium]|nr:TfoX/Sxy family protein [Actinomycetes bacterium]